VSPLEIDSLSISSSRREFVHEIGFQISDGASHGLIGESGSGKSLTARAILGLLPPQLRASGSVRLNGIEILNGNEGERLLHQGRSMAYIPQDPLSSLDPTMTIGRHARINKREFSTSALNNVLDAVELFDHSSILRSYPHQLSGGQRQRVLIAFALLARVQLIIADEPTSALDAGLQRPIIDLITSLAQQWGASLLLISHDLSLVAAGTTELTVLYRGSLCETGSTATLLSRPRHPYSADLIAKARSYYQPSLHISDPATATTATTAAVPLPPLMAQGSSHDDLDRGCPYRRLCRHASSSCDTALPPLISEHSSSFRCFHPLPEIRDQT
jgi:ABC-type dipeptide/oligopeptide/nickel transport system ATPase component